MLRSHRGTPLHSNNPSTIPRGAVENVPVDVQDFAAPLSTPSCLHSTSTPTGMWVRFVSKLQRNTEGPNADAKAPAWRFSHAVVTWYTSL